MNITSSISMSGGTGCVIAIARAPICIHYAQCGGIPTHSTLKILLIGYAQFKMFIVLNSGVVYPTPQHSMGMLRYIKCATYPQPQHCGYTPSTGAQNTIIIPTVGVDCTHSSIPPAATLCRLQLFWGKAKTSALSCLINTSIKEDMMITPRSTRML